MNDTAVTDIFDIKGSHELSLCDNGVAIITLNECGLYEEVRNVSITLWPLSSRHLKL